MPTTKKIIVLTVCLSLFSLLFHPSSIAAIQNFSTDALHLTTSSLLFQQSYVKASNTGANDRFGSSIAISGDTLVIGANGEASSATGVNGDQTSNTLPNAGAAYVFVRSGLSWVQQAYLKASNTQQDQFGISVDISGNTIVVGALQEDGETNTCSDCGAAYVFVRTGTTWTQEAILRASNPDPSDQFGIAVAISGDTILVGASQEDSASPGVDGNQADNTMSAAGAAYVFTRTAGVWSQQAYLKASNPGVSDLFGRYCSISGDTVAISAYYEASCAKGVNGDGSNNGCVNSGAVYLFTRVGTNWSGPTYLKASNTDEWDLFGSVVELSGDTLVIGAQGESSNATGVGGNQSDNSLVFAGAAYVFTRNLAGWSQQAYLKASNPGETDRFGYDATLEGDYLVISATCEDSCAPGINGDQANNNCYDAGTAYLFTRSGTTWSQQAYIKASNPGSSDNFGTSLDLAGGTLVVAAPWESSSALGIDGDQLDNSASNAGAAYVFFFQPRLFLPISLK